MQYNERPTGAFGAFAKWGVVLVAAGAIGTIGYLLMDEEVKRPLKLHGWLFLCGLE